MSDLSTITGDPANLPAMMGVRRILPLAGAMGMLLSVADLGVAQDTLPHTPMVSGMPRGVPLLCANATVVSAGSGAWSDPQVWSTGAVPAAGDQVAIAASHRVTYDVVADATLDCVEVRGHLAFATDADTRMRVGTLMVLEGGHLEIGSSPQPIGPRVTAEVAITDRPIDPRTDPGQVGNGLVGLGKVTMHGAEKTPTFVRLSREPRAGHTTLEVEQPVSGWAPGDYVVIPDTRQLRAGESGDRYRSQTERVQIAAVSGTTVTLATPLRFDHRGARSVGGELERLPHVGNLSRNVTVRSENPDGTRGHTIFISRADVDLRYAAFRDLGRTKNGAVDSTRFDTRGQVGRLGSNQLGRYAVHFHHAFGPRTTPTNGHQFTLIGNAVVGAPKWGITVHRSHYGLIQDNVVYDTRGAGIATEDGSESFNVFDHNFSLQSAGQRSSASSAGYAGATRGIGIEGAGFWFRGPNNYIRNNVAASAATYGFALPEGLGSIRTPAFKGADTSQADEAVRVDMTAAAVLEFTNNEAYGRFETGLEWVWNGAVSNFTVWHPSHHGFNGIPPHQLTLSAVTVRGDLAVLDDPAENPVGIAIGNYISRQVEVTGADVQAMRVGVLSPFFYGQTPAPGRGVGSLVVENGYFASQIGVSIATAYTSNAAGGAPVKTAEVRSSVFETFSPQAGNDWPAESISMNWGMRPRDTQPRDPIAVFDYNKQAGSDFRVYYSYDVPADSAPCGETREGIGGWVCEQ